GEGLTPEAIAYQEQRAQDYYGMFTKAVAKGRGVPIDAVRNGMGEGRVLGADAALAANMIDGIMTFEQVVKKMQRDARSSAAAGAFAGTVDHVAAAFALAPDNLQALLAHPASALIGFGGVVTSAALRNLQSAKVDAVNAMRAQTDKAGADGNRDFSAEEQA